MAKLLQKLIYAFLCLIGKIPRRCALTFSKALGTLWFSFDRKHRKVAVNNLTRAFGDTMSPAERNRLARTVFCNISRILFEIGWSLGLNVEAFMRNCRITGLDYVREAHAKGKGVLILTLHMGNWEFLPISFISQGFKVTPLYRPLDSEPIDRFILTYRQRFGGKPISKRNSMRKILSALKRQECVGILLDQNTERKSSVFVDFFGHPASTNKGLALIALKTGAPVLPVYIVSCGMRYEVVVGPQIPLINSGRKEDDILANTQAYNRIIESIIRKHPEQWLWIHQRWKTRPIKKRI